MILGGAGHPLWVAFVVQGYSHRVSDKLTTALQRAALYVLLATVVLLVAVSILVMLEFVLLLFR